MARRKSRLHGRETTTRFDDTQIRILQAVIILMVVGALGLIAAVVISAEAPALWLIMRGGGPSHSQDTTPRYTDIWAVYPDDRLRFVTIFYPIGGVLLTQREQVTVAGPLLRSPDDVEYAETFGGDLIDSEFLSGPGADSGLIYELFTLQRTLTDAPYGVDVMAISPPYIIPDGEQRELALGTDPQGYYAQVIVAVAFPRGTRITDIPGMPPYRRVRVGGWVVYYFDTTAATGEEAIRFRYRPPQSAPDDLDAFEVDARR